MAREPNYAQGGDAQAISRVAEANYDSYANMFELHGWPERGNKIMPAVQSRVVNAYGSIRAFERAHEPDSIMSPMEAISTDPPNVWLTSFYGFGPEGWGFLGFADEERRRGFIKSSRPGALIVVYGGSQAPKEERGKIIGIQQCSHRLAHSRYFMAPHMWTDKQRNPETEGRWNYAVKAVRAWRIQESSRMDVRQFASESTASGAWQHIGARGVRLSWAEAQKILTLDLEEVDVYGESPILGSSPASAEEIFAPSRAGPVSQNPFLTKESEGPKHLYILRLTGNADAFVGDSVGRKLVIKAGFSKFPLSRCGAHNRTLPGKCAFKWEIYYSGDGSGHEPYPSSEHAKAGERAMQEVLCREPAGKSLGGEFFLAEPELIDEAWTQGNLAARNHRQ